MAQGFLQTILIINTHLRISVETGSLPGRNLLNQPVFDRIEMDVMKVVFEIPLIADSMLPKPALPDRGFFL